MLGTRSRSQPLFDGVWRRTEQGDRLGCCSRSDGIQDWALVALRAGDGLVAVVAGLRTSSRGCSVGVVVEQLVVLDLDGTAVVAVLAVAAGMTCGAGRPCRLNALDRVLVAEDVELVLVVRRLGPQRDAGNHSGQGG